MPSEGKPSGTKSLRIGVLREEIRNRDGDEVADDEDGEQASQRNGAGR